MKRAKYFSVLGTLAFTGLQVMAQVQDDVGADADVRAELQAQAKAQGEAQALFEAEAKTKGKVYVVRFKESSVPPVKPGTVRDDRVTQNAEMWAHVGERTMAHVQRTEKRHGIKAEAAFGTVMKGMSVRLSPEKLEALRRDPSVDLIEEEKLFSIVPMGKPSGVTVSSSQVIPWGISKTMATQSYTLAGNGSGEVSEVRAYIIDTGLDMSNAELNRMGHINLVGDGRDTDCNGHGTHVAGTLAAYDNLSGVVGVGPGVAVYGVKVLNCRGSGTTSSVIRGVDWVAANAIKPAVVNMSLGGGTSQLLDDAVRNAAARGLVFSIAAGNSAANACNSSPARLGGGSVTGVMTVAATDINDREATFSNYGNCVDIWAPGVSINSLRVGSGTASMSGTSMASPHVAGAMALYFGRYPSLTASSVVSTLKNMAVKTGTFSRDGRAITRLNANVQ